MKRGAWKDKEDALLELIKEKGCALRKRTIAEKFSLTKYQTDMLCRTMRKKKTLGMHKNKYWGLQ